MKIQINDEIREATIDEAAVIEAARADVVAQLAAFEAVSAAKVSARSKLKALGLTDDEIAALVG